jgi:hypothetical protein
MLLEYLREIPDHRRGQGRMYDLAGVLMVTILAVLSGARSYRDIHTFAKTHLRRLRQLFGLSWLRVPSYNGIRIIIQGTSAEAMESAFRAYSAAVAAKLPEGEYLACDGKALRGSFDHMEDKRASELLSVFATDNRLILAHMEIADKTNEIPAFQQLVKELGLTGKLFTLDAMHTQKNPSSRQGQRQRSAHAGQGKPEATAG